MANFESFAPKLKQWEGGFVNDPDDKGGATNCGVTLETFRQYYGRTKQVKDLKAMTKEQWSWIMKTGYWDKIKADQIKNQSLAELCADWLVNAGVGKIKDIQKAIGVAADGIVGPRTLAALNTNPAVAFYKIHSARVAWYEALIRRNPVYEKYRKGWLNRCNFWKFIN